MRVGVLSAVHAPVEARLVAAVDAPATGLQVVRRCADLTEVTALVIAGIGTVAVLGGALPGVDRASIARLRDTGAAVILLADVEDVDRCRSLGADAVLRIDAEVGEIVAAAGACARRLAPERESDRRRPGHRPAHEVPGGEQPAAGAQSVAADRIGDGSSEQAGGDEERRGRLVAVWGPSGAPGRTTVAVNLAAELAGLGAGTLLVDADTWGGSVAQALGLLDESAGLAAAVRAGGHGVLDVGTLRDLAPEVEGRLRVLTGLSRPGRWRELAPSALEAVWQTARAVADWTVVDCGFCLEDDDGSGFEAMLGLRRNGATLSALTVADVVVVVGAAEPVGIHRLVQGLADLDEALGSAGRRLVVANRLRASAAGAAPERSVTEALVRYAGVSDVALVPDDRPALDRAMLEGRTLRASAPGSPARLAIYELAATLAGAAAGRRVHARQGRGRGRGRRAAAA